MKPKDFIYIVIILGFLLSNMLLYMQYDIYHATTFEKNFYLDKLTEVSRIVSKDVPFSLEMQQILSKKYKITKQGNHYNLMPLDKRSIQNDHGIYITTDSSGKITGLGRDKP